MFFDKNFSATQFRTYYIYTVPTNGHGRIDTTNLGTASTIDGNKLTLHDDGFTAVGYGGTTMYYVAVKN